ncbi:hypothetical protein [Pseudomonas fragi]|uniref:hypothetical protein n=1 Tax=Pseudomonas fragi TaxID=296 RepID=UPI000BA1D847|nr:hypothetical protein [Pseudomonas fragi]PAA14421.1 hypothetical protein CJU74_15040 [Pseudomonas fragi]
MKGLGIFAIVVGIGWMIFALSMDVSVSTGMGRVNNLGLMADRQLHTIVGGMIALAGLLMLLFGGKVSVSPALIPAQTDTRPCPLCAETIKNAAIKCRHCGADIEQATRLTPATGWTVRIPCRPGMEFDATQNIISGEGLPCEHPDGAVVVIGPYEEKKDAVEVLKQIRENHSIFGELSYKG